MRSNPPALLTVASYYGTLAATRCLGRAGVPVTMAEPALLAPARWSRFVSRRERCPPVEQPDAFIQWLLDFGRRAPGHVLYPTSDEVAVLLSRHRADLERDFRLYQPPLATIQALLDKRALAEAGTRAGLASPECHFPRSEAELAELARTAQFPLLLKPLTQVLLGNHAKGRRVNRPEELPAAYRAFQAENRYHPLALELFPSARQPMLQAFLPEAARGIRSVAGFVDEAGRLVAAGARKVLQRPRQLGIGLCFEETPVGEAVAEGLARLCREVGYHGVFEAELVEADGRALLIDFNPRFYSQMAFEIDRGLPLPLLAYRAALGQRAALDALFADAAQAARASGGRVYCHRLILEVLTRAQRLSGRMSPVEQSGWQRWVRDHRGRISDAVADRADPLPTVVDWAGSLYRYGRHPRAFVRQIVLDR